MIYIGIISIVIGILLICNEFKKQIDDKISVPHGFSIQTSKIEGAKLNNTDENPDFIILRRVNP